MTTNYSIYVVNAGAQTQEFWCFLTPPETLNGPDVYANSSANLTVAPNYGGTNCFVVPVQYIVGAGASNEAVGLNVKVISNFKSDTNLGQAWLATYYDAPPNQGPTIAADGTTSASQIAITTSAFNEVGNDNAGWFANQSFGIQTAAGFMGMTWAPSPQQVRTITPLLSFYVAVGSYGQNTLASWDQVSTGSAQINAPTSFDSSGNCTVTYNADGSWTVTPGLPNSMSAELAWLRSEAHHRMMALAYLDAGEVVSDTLATVKFDSDTVGDAAGQPVVKGSLTVSQALLTGFATFILSGVKFDISSQQGQYRVNFSYSGPLSASFVKSLFKAGASLGFSK